MSQQAVERTLGQLLTDERLRERFLHRPAGGGPVVSPAAVGHRTGGAPRTLSLGVFSASLDPRMKGKYVYIEHTR